MSDINGISQNDQSRRDVENAEQRKRIRNAANNTKITYVGVQTTQSSSNVSSRRTFDSVLENYQQPELPSMPHETAVPYAIHELPYEEDSGSRHEPKREDSDKKSKDPEVKPGKSRRSSEGVQEKVIAKDGLSERGHGGNSGQSKEQKADVQLRDKSVFAKATREELIKKEQVTAPGFNSFDKTFESQMEVRSMEAQRKLPPQVLEQIVNYVKLTKKDDLEKIREMEINFHDNFFNGLRVKVASRDGRDGKEMTIEFFAPNQRVKEIFQNEREAIAIALGNKGLDVSSIKVHSYEEGAKLA